jgi:hypothetical protein
MKFIFIENNLMQITGTLPELAKVDRELEKHENAMYTALNRSIIVDVDAYQRMIVRGLLPSYDVASMEIPDNKAEEQNISNIL